jgi:hypothetical protein
VEFLTALALVGDTSCLESIAGAYARTVRAAPKGDDWWGRHLADVFTMIVARDRVTRRHPVMKKILKRWPEVIDSR